MYLVRLAEAVNCTVEDKTAGKMQKTASEHFLTLCFTILSLDAFTLE